MNQKKPFNNVCRIYAQRNTKAFGYLLEVLGMFVGLKLEQVHDPSQNYDILYGDYNGLKPDIPRIPYRINFNKDDIPLATDFFTKISEKSMLRETTFPFDIFTAIRFWLLDEGNLPRPKGGADEHQRLLASHSIQAKLNILEDPIVNRYVLLFSKWIERVLGKQTSLPLPEGAKAAIILSHDVDYTFDISITYRLNMLRKCAATNNLSMFTRQILKLQMDLLRILSGKRQNFWMFPHTMDSESKFGLRSTYFFGSISNTQPNSTAMDVPYRLESKKLNRLFAEMREKEFEIGLHPSYIAYRSDVQMAFEKKRLEKFTKMKVFGLRHHFWHIGDPFWPTLKKHSDVGFLYDSSLAFNDTPGFRLSCSLPFYPYDPDTGLSIDTLQVPTGIMDGAYFYHSNFTSNMALNSFEKMVENVKLHRGVFALDWHNRTSYPGNRIFAEWGRTFQKILDIISSDKELFVGSFKQYMDLLLKEGRIR